MDGEEWRWSDEVMKWGRVTALDFNDQNKKNMLCLPLIEGATIQLPGGGGSTLVIFFSAPISME